MIGCSFMVTVQAPNAPCRQTKASSTLGSAGENLRSRRPDFSHMRQAITTSAMIRTPTAIAR